MTSTLMMKAETVSETSDSDTILARLITREDVIPVLKVQKPF
jgi:fructose-bisphosphate aldolase class 1